MRDRFIAYIARIVASPARTGEGTREVRARAGAVPVLSFAIIYSFLLILLFSSTGWSLTPSGTIISNSAKATYSDSFTGSPVTAASNTVSTTTAIRRTRATIEFLQYAPDAPGAQSVMVPSSSYSPSGSLAGPFAPVNTPSPAGTAAKLDLSKPLLLIPATQYHTGEPVFVRVIDGDQNNDPSVAETVVVTLHDDKTGDTEVLKLTETGPNTGVFTGVIQSSSDQKTDDNGLFNLVNDSHVTAAYVDAADSTDAHTAAALVDPYGIVFNSSTGLPIDGAVVTLIDNATGSPATVYGDDGVSLFPATLTTGGTAQDSAGKVYTLSPGGYRFPFIKPGRYHLDIQPSAGYKAPSTVGTAVLQALPGAPFAIAEPGSRSEEFLVNAGPAIHIDIPIDPLSSRLYLIKSVLKDTAAIGDFVPYQLIVENIDKTAPVPSVTIVDRLPVGFRYRKGSTRLNSLPAAEPIISEDGRSITFTIGDLKASEQAEVGYVAEVGAGANLGKAINTANAYGSLGATSNTAAAAVLVTEDLYMTKTTVIGRVLDGCKDGHGVAGVRIFLEDGTYVVTDKNGMYHFAALNAGTHVVQLDTITAPVGYEPVLCEENTRFSGTAFSQFVDLQGGSLWRADFYLSPRTPQKKQVKEQTGEVALELRSSLVTTRMATSNLVGLVQTDLLVTAQTWTFGVLCFGELKTIGSPASASETRTEIVPLVSENCCTPDDNGRYNTAYAAHVSVGTVPVQNLRLVMLMPDSVAYTTGSSCLDAGTVPDPELGDGVITYRLGDRAAGWEGNVLFMAKAPAAGPEGNLTTKAFLLFDTTAAKGLKTPLADTNLVRYALKRQQSEPDAVFHPKFKPLKANLSSDDLKEIEKIVQQLRTRSIEHITVIGHTDSNRIRPGASKEFPDNYALSQARAKTVARVIAESLHLTPDRITVLGKGPDDPIASNETEDGRALNRRVEFILNAHETASWTYVRNDKEASGKKTAIVTVPVQDEGPVPTKQPEPRKSAAVSGAMPDYNSAWVEKASPGLEWLWPMEGYHPSIASTRIAVKTDPRLKPQLILNGEEVDGRHYDGTIRKSDNTVAISFWSSIHLIEGDNKMELVFRDAAGNEAGRLTRTVHYSGTPVKAVLLPERSRFIADGKNPVALAVRFLDKDGQPAREGLLGDYTIDAPYISKQRVDELQKSPLVAPTSERSRYTINDDGVAMIELSPTTQTGEAVLHVQLDNTRSEEIRAWLKPEDRDWVLVGLAEGTVGYNVVKGNMETFTDSNGNDKYYEEDRLAFYAKGRVKGEWLLTLAYDSKKAAADQQGLYQTIDPNKYYTLYGDATTQANDAASAKHIYVKLERDQFYALFGDFNAGLSVTELSRYNRNFTGVRSELKTRQFEYNVFAADTNQAHVRDEFPGDGTSGLYHLSRKNIVLNSEMITIETRDRFKSEVVVSTRQLARYLDYTIDYEAGTIFFKAPVNSRDNNFNPVFIVAEYESFSDADVKYNYGGRAAVHVLENRAEVGASYIHEGQVGGSGNLEGLDAKIKLSESDTLRAETASTRTDQTTGATKGSAYLAELRHRSETLEGKVYVREQDASFGLGQQSLTETGTRKVGTDLNYLINKSWTAGGEMFEQNNLSTGDVRDMAEVRGNYTQGRLTALGGIRRAEDTLSTAQTVSFGETQRSDQVFLGMNYQLTDRLSMRTRRDQSVGANDNVDFPTRTLIGLDYKLNEKSSLYADQEWTQGSYADTETTRIGIRTSPWAGGQIGSSVEQQTTENGVRLFSSTGLKQSWQVTKEWSIDAGLDRSQTLRNTATTYTVNPNVPPASGSSEDFTAISLGVGYRQEKWSWTARGENRVSDSEHKYGVFVGANGEVRNGLALAAGLQAFKTVASTGQEGKNNDVRLALAYRPFETRYVVLDRLDLIQTETHGGTAVADDNQRIINNFVTNIKTDEKTQVSAQYASKYVRETIDANDYHGYTDLMGLEGRYDVTRKWDLGLRGMRLHSWSINQEKYGTGASVGFNAGRNMWISLGYNFSGFKDRDFSKADFTSEGPFIKLRMKFDQASVRDAVKWFSGQ